MLAGTENEKDGGVGYLMRLRTCLPIILLLKVLKQILAQLSISISRLR